MTATGTAGGYDVTATQPPTVAALDQYKLFGVRSSATWYYNSDGNVDEVSGLILQSSNLYAAVSTYQGTATTPTVKAYKLGTGWSGFSRIVTSNYTQGPAYHTYIYGLHTNGSIYRYKLGDGVRSYGSAPGFSSVKTMTVIAETASYDTLLVTTKGGALYTVHVPLTAPMKPVVKLVRKAGFSAFESLVAQRCGAASTLLTGVDHDTKTATVYGVSRATGTSTLIKSFGTFKAGFGGAVHFLITGAYGPQLVGE